MKMKVTEKPPEINDELNEGDQSDSLLNEMDENKYKVQVGINERIRRRKSGHLTKTFVDSCEVDCTVQSLFILDLQETTLQSKDSSFILYNNLLWFKMNNGCFTKYTKRTSHRVVLQFMCHRSRQLLK